MAGYGVANERLRVLEELEREIGASLQSAGGRGVPRGGAPPRVRVLGSGVAAPPGSEAVGSPGRGVKGRTPRRPRDPRLGDPGVAAAMGSLGVRGH
uniref:Uncharacterized protein n=1 Tax=Dromaius novaehollandiae TaxID=8790 RepID=A0A8C4JRZ2_DRONO